jgi:hypothetical protein
MVAYIHTLPAIKKKKMTKILRLLAFILIVFIVNICIRYPIVLLFNYLYEISVKQDPYNVIDNIFSFYWFSTIVYSAREYGAICASLYLGLLVIKSGKITAFYIGSIICIMIVIASFFIYPVDFGELGIGEFIGELFILLGKGFSIYKGLQYMKNDYTYEEDDNYIYLKDFEKYA